MDGPRIQSKEFLVYLSLMSESFVAHFEHIETRLLSKTEMDPQLPATHIPVARRVLVKAIKTYADNLSDSDKTAFKAAQTIQALLRRIQRNNQVYSSSSVTGRVDRVLQGLENFTSFLGTNHSELVGLLMGGVRFTFRVGTNIPESETGNRSHYVNLLLLFGSFALNTLSLSSVLPT